MKKTLIFMLLFCLVTAFSGCVVNKESAYSNVVESVSQANISEDTEDPVTSSDAFTTVPEDDILMPIHASSLKDGSYLITVDSSSSMFRVVKCELIVENDAMKAIMTMSGHGYGMVYMGTGEEALLDTEENYIPFVLDEEGAKTFTVPVEALNMELDCAAWSIRKEKWYDRTLIFQSDELPADALIVE
jgi:hypothetical protein